jgi:hypothetical protein
MVSCSQEKGLKNKCTVHSVRRAWDIERGRVRKIFDFDNEPGLRSKVNGSFVGKIGQLESMSNRGGKGSGSL